MSDLDLSLQISDVYILACTYGVDEKKVLLAFYNLPSVFDVDNNDYKIALNELCSFCSRRLPKTFQEMPNIYIHKRRKKRK